MKYRIVVITVLTSLLLTGCAGEQSVTVESQVKLIEYEKCLLLQQDALNIINNQLAQDESFSRLIEILERQAIPEGTARFDIHLKNCEKYLR
jgi:uncharacterized protein YcfL